MAILEKYIIAHFYVWNSFNQFCLSSSENYTRPFKSFGFKTAFVISLSNTFFFGLHLQKLQHPLAKIVLQKCFFYYIFMNIDKDFFLYNDLELITSSLEHAIMILPMYDVFI